MKLVLYLLFLCITPSAFSQDLKPDTLSQPEIKLELCLVDAPYITYAAKTANNGSANVAGYVKAFANPSMHQSLSLTTSLYSASHYGLKKLFAKKNGHKPVSKFVSVLKKIAYPVSVYFADQLFLYMPGGDGWLHEEYHRAVMTRRLVNSFNDINKFPLGATAVSVSHLKDADLVRFKKEDPAGFTRMHVAGIEGEYSLVDKLQRNNFFKNQALLHEFTYFFTTLNSIFYVKESSNPETVDVETDNLNQKENNIPVRDFAGFDFSAWVYDLFRPNEPYEQRGIHPSGVGINRYRKTTDLTTEELSYLKKQGHLQFLNLGSPMMIGVRKINLGQNRYGNIALRHLLTSFGSDISLNLFFKNSKHRAVLIYHHFQNYKNSFPALEGEIIEHPISKFGKKFLISPRFIAGLQPSDQDFKTNKSSFLGLLSCKVGMRSKWIQPYVELEAKTRGWVAGNEFLNSNLSFRAGISTTLN